MKYLDVSSGQHNFPSRDIAEDQKNEPLYNLNYNKAIYSRYLNDKGGVLYSSRGSLDLIRLYGKGVQPADIYKSYYQERVGDTDSSASLTQQRSEKTREGFENIAMRVISPLPRIKTIIKGYLDMIGQDVFVDAVDPLSNNMKENMKYRMFTIAQNMDFISEYHYKAGIPMQELEFRPVNMTELNLYEAMGGFKLNYARAMEKLIQHTEQLSEAEDFLKDAWIDDAVDLGVIASRVVYDPKIQKYVYKYIDPKYYVTQFVKNHEYDRSEWAGYVERYTISELKQIMPDKPEDYFKNIADRYRGKSGNKEMDHAEFDNFSKHTTQDGVYNYDDFVVEVLESEWVDYECSRHLIYDSVHGRKSVHKLGAESEITELEEKQKQRGARQKDMKVKMRKLRGAKWIIGTDVVFDYGLVNMQDRPQKTEVAHSFRLYCLRDYPITEQLIPIADDMAIAWYRWQDDRASLVRRGYAVDVSMLENIDDGGKSFKMLDILKAWKDTRYLFHQQSMSGKYEGGMTTPIQPIPSQIMESLEEFITTWDAALKRIEDVTGINLVMLGASAPAGSQVTTTQMSAASAIHVLKPIIKTMGRMKTNLAKTTMRRLQLAFKVRPDMVKSYADVVGEADIELLRQAEKSAVQYGMTFEDRPSQEAKDNILGAATASLQARRDGKPGIDLSQFVYITQQLEAGGNLKELAAILDYLMLKSEQALREKEKENITLQNEGLAKMEQQKAQAAERQSKMEHSHTMQQIDRNGQWKIVEQYGVGTEAPQTPTGAPNSPVGGTSPPQGTNVPLEAQSP